MRMDIWSIFSQLSSSIRASVFSALLLTLQAASMLSAIRLTYIASVKPSLVSIGWYSLTRLVIPDDFVPKLRVSDDDAALLQELPLNFDQTCLTYEYVLALPA